jgi:hypothetical protein
MSGVSPVGIAANGTRSGKRSFFRALCSGVVSLFIGLVFPNLPSYLPSLAPGLVPSGQHYYEGSDSSACASEVCTLRRSPCLSRLNFSAFRLQPPYCHFACLGLVRYHYSPCKPPSPTASGYASRPCESSLGRFMRSEVRVLLVRSPTGLAESSSLSLRTAHSPPVALHLSCWKRSYLRIRGGNDFPDRDFHPTIQSPSQAH